MVNIPKLMRLFIRSNELFSRVARRGNEEVDRQITTLCNQRSDASVSLAYVVKVWSETEISESRDDSDNTEKNRTTTWYINRELQIKAVSKSAFS